MLYSNDQNRLETVAKLLNYELNPKRDFTSNEEKCEACDCDPTGSTTPKFPLIWTSVSTDLRFSQTEGGTPGWYHVVAHQFPFKSEHVLCTKKNTLSSVQQAELAISRLPAKNEYPRNAGEVMGKQGWEADNSVGSKPEKADVKQMPPRMEEDTVNFHLKCLAGRILTLVDALISGDAQNKAFKTYVKKEFREQFHRVFGFFHTSGFTEDQQTSYDELTIADKELF